MIFKPYLQANKQKQKASFYKIQIKRKTEMKTHVLETPSTEHKRSPSFSTNLKSSYSPRIFSSSHRKKVGNYTSKLSNLKSTLDDLICLVSQKKYLQTDVIKQVWDVNTQLENHLMNNEIPTREVVSKYIRKDSNRDSKNTSLFGDASTYIEFKNVFNHLSEQEQIIRLKQTLNNKIQSTNSLMGRLKQLQLQYQYLKEHESLSENQNLRQYRLNRDEIQQNKRLKAELMSLNESKKSGYSLTDLWREFCQLKQQNQRLRQETIQILKASNGDGDNLYGKKSLSSTCVY